MTNRPESRPIDLDQARRLLDALEQDLRHTDAGQDIDAITDRVAELKRKV